MLVYWSVWTTRPLAGSQVKRVLPKKNIKHVLWESDFKSSTYDLSWSFYIQSLFKGIQSNTPPDMNHVWESVLYMSTCYLIQSWNNFGGVFFRVVWITSSHRQVAIARCSCKQRRSLHSNPLRWHLQAFATQRRREGKKCNKSRK